MKVKIITREDLTTPGDMFLLDNARMASIQFALGDPYLREEDPARIIICHPTDQPQLEELIRISEDVELIEDPEPDPPAPMTVKCTCGHPRMGHPDNGPCSYNVSSIGGFVRCDCTKFEEAK